MKINFRALANWIKLAFSAYMGIALTYEYVLDDFCLIEETGMDLVFLIIAILGSWVTFVDTLSDMKGW